MKNKEPDFSRRKFVKNMATTSVALNSMVILESFNLKTAGDSKIYLPENSPLAQQNAAQILADAINASIINQKHSGSIKKGEIIMVVGKEIESYPEAFALLTDIDLNKEWEIVKQTGGGYVFAGRSARNLCHAVLVWIEHPARETDRLSTYRFDERYTMWDSSLNQFFRYSKHFDRESHVYDLARLGFTGMEINRYVDPGGFHVNHRKFPADSYAWYMSYAPALDAFVESSYTKDLYPKKELINNLKDLKEAAELSRKYGMKPGFVCYEPRGVYEKVFDRHPGLRGARIDHPGRSLEPRYSLDIANPKVLDHYAESITNLMREVPDLSYFVFWTQDSGSGLPFSRRLYAGPNGSYLARAQTLGMMTRNFISAILDAGRRINPEFEVIMKMDWEYTEKERLEISKEIPEGATLAHIFGNRAIKVSEFSNREEYVINDRKVGIEPYPVITVSASWEAEPIIGITRPSVLADKINSLEDAHFKRLMTRGGIFSKAICPYDITQELYSELIRTKLDDVDGFIYEMANQWCNGNEPIAKKLIEAWHVADDAFEDWPVMTWYDMSAAGPTQARWLTRPLVPDITLLNDEESEAWKRVLFPLPWDIARVNISFEGGIRMYTEEDLATAVNAFDNNMLPKMDRVIDILNDAIKSSKSKIPVLMDQRDRYLGFLYRSISIRNLYDAQWAINNTILKVGNPAELRKRLTEAICSEIENTKNWIKLLKTSKIYFFRVTEREETPFQYKTPLADFRLKLQVMQDHIEDKPGPYIEELFKDYSDRNLLFYD